MVRESKKKEQKKSTTDRVLVDKQGIALAFGISLPTVSVRIREGMPCVQEGGRGKAWQFDLAECVQWHTDRAIEKAVGVTDEGMTMAEVEKAIKVEELKVKKVQAATVLHEVCLLDEVARAVSSVFIEVRQGFLSLPERTALRLLAVESETEIKEILQTEIDLVLTALASSDVLEDVFDDS